MNSHRFYSFNEDQYLELAEKVMKMQHGESCQKLSTQSDGSLKLAIPLYDVPENVTKLSLKVTAVDHLANETTLMKQPSITHDVALTHSNTTAE